MDIRSYFDSPQNLYHRQYEAVRTFLYEKKSADEVAQKYNYTKSTVYAMARDFKNLFIAKKLDDYLFSKAQLGRPEKTSSAQVKDKIIALRKHYLSVEEIKEILDAQDEKVSKTFIYHAIASAGFARLPKRTKLAKIETQSNIKIEAPVAKLLNGTDGSFGTSNIGVLCFLPLIAAYEIDNLIINSNYPETKTIPKINSILSFIALKLSNIKRYTKDDLWCMDRGLGLFAGLNVLPKATWFSSYSHRINMFFLKAMHKLWQKNGLLSETANLDFTTVPYWGDDSHVENNWSGTRHKALASILAVVAQDPDNGIITYMVIKVDFDLTMTILAYNLYRLFAKELPRYTHQTAEKLYEKFISNSGKVTIDENEIVISLKKKRHLPAMLSMMKNFTPCTISWLEKNYDPCCQLYLKIMVSF